jgi:hypothetical protein
MKIDENLYATGVSATYLLKQIIIYAKINVLKESKKVSKKLREPA